MEIVGNNSEKRELSEFSVTARLSAASIGIDRIRNLQFNDKIYSPDYILMKKRLVKMRQECSEFSSIYLTSSREDSIFILVDSYPEDSNEYLPPGHFFAKAPNVLHEFFRNENQGSLSKNMKWDDRVSIYAPITDGNNIIAVFGLDYPAESLNQSVAFNRILTIAIVSLIMMLMISFYITFGRRQELIERISSSENALRNSEEQFRTLYENSAIGLYRTTPDGRILLANPKLVHMLGFENLEEMTKRNLEHQEYEPHYSRSEFRSRIESEDKIIGLESTWTKKDGTTLLIRENAKTIRNENGTVLYYEGSAEDITKIKQIELQLQNYTEELFSLNASKDKLFSIIAHDLRGPFHPILNLSEILNTEIDSLTKEEIKEFARDINKSANNVFRLIENLLEWSRTQSGQIEFKPVLINLNAITGEVIRNVKASALEKNIELSNLVPESIVVNGDNQMLHSILHNLISNSIKFTKPGGKVMVKARILIDVIEVSIEDNGVGISGIQVAQMFRLDKNISTRGTNLEKGSGLGLILCKEFVQKHNGNIWVESELGIGTKFYFTLPYNPNVN